LPDGITREIARLMKRKILCAAGTGMLLMVLLAAGLAGWLVYRAHNSLPELDGLVTHPSLKGEARVVRDDWGVPHITAENEPDACFALGYAMAQDRLFQMELLRILARGELASVLGPPLVKVDRVIRSFLLRPRSEAWYARNRDSVPPELLAAAEAFLAGLNHALEVAPAPFEYSVLGLEKRPFTLPDMLTVAAILPISFADGIRGDALNTMLSEKYPDMDVGALFPGYSLCVPATIMESLDEAEAWLEEKKQQEKPGVTPLSQRREKEEENLEEALGEMMDVLRGVSSRFGPQLGSNSWVVGPSKTASGKPILANDPHVGFTNPGIWYEAHIRYEDTEVYGYYLPLIPFPLLGHNRRHAWGLTMFANDDVDMYRETFHPDDPAKVMYKGEWTDVRFEKGVIPVRFGPDAEYTIRVTPHGPVITDLFRLLAGYAGPEISLSWVWQHLEYTDIQGLYRLLHADSLESFEAGAALFTSPGINISYAGAEDNIAWWAAGRIVIRPDHVNPKELLDGASGRDEILGYVPFEQNPHLINPPWDYIVTANNKSTVKPVGPAADLAGYWQPDDRARRIEEVIESRDDWTLEAMKALQFDDLSIPARDLKKVITAIAGSMEEPLPLEKKAVAILQEWDGRHGLDSRGATIFRRTCDFILDLALRDELGENGLRLYTSLGDSWNFMKAFIGNPDAPFWDNIGTPEKESRETIVRRAFRNAIAGLADHLGPDPDTWTWQRINTMEFKHPFGYLPGPGRLLNIGPFPSTGYHHVVNNMIAMNGVFPYEIVAGPSTRRLIDYGDVTHSLTILPTGNSGHFLSPHYDDQAALFMRGQYREVRFTPEQIEAHKKHELLFRKP
jgi:penicillin G amidase